VWDWRSTLYNWRFCQLQSHVTQKLESKFRPDQIQILCPSLRISGQLPAPIVNGGEDSFWKWKDFQLSRARDLDLDLGSGHAAYCRASLVDLHLHAKCHWNRNTFVDGRTYGRTGGHLRPTLLGRLRRIDLKRQRRQWWISGFARAV